MEYILSWGSPVGIGAFMFLMGAGMGLFFWGVFHIKKEDGEKS